MAILDCSMYSGPSDIIIAHVHIKYIGTTFLDQILDHVESTTLNRKLKYSGIVVVRFCQEGRIFHQNIVEQIQIIISHCNMGDGFFSLFSNIHGNSFFLDQKFYSLEVITLGCIENLHRFYFTVSEQITSTIVLTTKILNLDCRNYE